MVDTYFENEAPFVSIVIPAKNEGKYIRRCLNSVINLDYHKDKMEIIVIDNNSSDSTLSIAREFEDVKVFEKKDGTIGAVRNYGASCSVGSIIAFLDGDCVPDEEWLKKGVGHLIENKDICCVGFTVGSPQNKDSWIEKTWYKMGSSSKHSGICNVKWLSSFNLILNREEFLNVGGFDERLETCEDVELGYKLSEISRLLYSDELEVRHLGNAKTLKEFFLKEMWRGKSNFKSYLQNKNYFKDFPSVFMPVGYVLLVLILLVLLIMKISGTDSFVDRKSTRLNSSHTDISRMPSSA